MWGSSGSSGFAPPDVKRVYGMLTPRPKELINNSSNRRYLREGEVMVWNAKEKKMKNRYFFLFNDVCLLCKREGRNSYLLKVFISLRTSLRIEDVEDSVHAGKVEFRLYAPKKTFIFFARSQEEKHSWIRDIRACCGGEYGAQDRPANEYGASPLETKDSMTMRQQQTMQTQQQFQETQQTQPAQQQTGMQLSGDIGKIEIPGMSTRSTGDNSGLRSGSNDGDSDDDTFGIIGQTSSFPEMNQQSQQQPQQQQQPHPMSSGFGSADSSSSSASAVDPFDALASRNSASSIGSSSSMTSQQQQQPQQQQEQFSAIDDPFGLLTIGTSQPIQPISTSSASTNMNRPNTSAQPAADYSSLAELRPQAQVGTMSGGMGMQGAIGYMPNQQMGMMNQQQQQPYQQQFNNQQRF